STPLGSCRLLVGRSLAQSAEGEKRAMSCLQVTVAVRDHQGWPALPDAELPGEVVGCHAVHADAEAVDAVQVVGRADGDPVVAHVVAAARAVEDVVVVQAGARRAGRDRAAPAVALEDGIAMPGGAFPLGHHVEKAALEALPA